MESRFLLRRALVAVALLSASLFTTAPAPSLGPGSARGCKPLPGVQLRWEGSGPRLAGRVVTATLVLTTRFPVDDLKLGVDVPRGIRLLDPAPSFHGAMEAGDSLAFPVRIEVPSSVTPPLTAEARVRTRTVRYRVGARWDATPLSLRPSRRAPGRLVSTEAGERMEFPARRPGGRETGSGGRGVDATASPVPTAPGNGSGFPAVSPEGTVEVTGRAWYRDRLFGPGGFLYASYEENPLRPIRHADAELYRVQGGNEVLLQTGFTDTLGWFRFPVTEADGDSFRVRVLTRTEAWGEARLRVLFSVTNAVPYDIVTDSFARPASGESVGDFVAEPEQGGEGFNLLDSCLRGMDVVNSLAGSYPDWRVTVYWNEASTQGSYFQPWSNTIYLVGDEGYDDCIVTHEFGHFVAANYSKDDSPAGIHYVDDSNQDLRLAWSEGWASYFQSAVRASSGDPYPSWYVDTFGTPGKGQLWFSYDCEGPGYAVHGAGSEVVVQGLLWDIEDGPDTPDPWPGTDDDPLHLPRSDTWKVFTGPLRNATYVSLEDFWDGWFSPQGNNHHRAEMEQTFGALGAEFFPDSLEDDDDPASAVELALDGVPVHHTFYPVGDEDYQRFSLDAGEGVTVETLNIVGFGDTYLEILGPDSTVIGFNSNRSGGDMSSLVAFTAPAAGTYTVHVQREFTGDAIYSTYGSYDLRGMRGVAHPVAMVPSPASSGVLDAGFGVAAGWADYDGDGAPDLYVVNNTAQGVSTSHDVFFHNLGNGSFANVTTSAGLGSPEGGIAVTWGDYDNDGFPDLFVSDHGLYHNLATGRFEDVTAASGVEDIGREFDAAWVDADADGLLDLFVLRRDGPSALWHNNGDGTFTDIAPEAGFAFPDSGGDSYGCAWGDYDGDRLPDLFLAQQSDPVHVLYHNLGGNRFEDVTTAAGVAGTDPAAGAAWADVNNDERLDLFVASNGADRLYVNRGDGTFADESERYGVNDPGLAKGAAFADYDLDGDMDLYVVNVSGPNLLFQNMGGTMFRVPEAADAEGQAYGCAWADMDGDGDPDLYVTRGCGGNGCRTDNILYRNALNDGDDPRPWLAVALRGKECNRDGLGALVEVHAGGHFQARQMGTGSGWASKSLVPLLFGFPDGVVVDSVEVFWPNGHYNVVRGPASNATLVIEEDTSTPVAPPGVAPPLSVRLLPAFPNPFTAGVTIPLRLSRAVPVRVEVFDLSGRRVRVLANGLLPAGEQILGWDGEDSAGRPAPAGIYFYRLAAAGRLQVRKLVRMTR